MFSNAQDFIEKHSTFMVCTLSINVWQKKKIWVCTCYLKHWCQTVHRIYVPKYIQIIHASCIRSVIEAPCFFFLWKALFFQIRNITRCYSMTSDRIKQCFLHFKNILNTKCVSPAKEHNLKVRQNSHTGGFVAFLPQQMHCVPFYDPLVGKTLFLDSSSFLQLCYGHCPPSLQRLEVCTPQTCAHGGSYGCIVRP